MLTLDSGLWAMLNRVNRAVNRRPYRIDMDLYGQEDFWEAIGPKGGDCEDYALAKRAELLRLGLPLNALRLAVCRTETGEGHAVLTVDTDKGTYVLDNRHEQPMRWEKLPYRWVMRQRDREWVRIGGSDEG